MKKKKISILTFAKGDNYGAVLQAYSLAEVLRRMGYDVEFIHLTWTNWKNALLSRISPLSRRFEKFRQEYLKDISKRCRNIDDLKEVTRDADMCIVGSDQVWNPMITTIRALHYFFNFLPDRIPRISYAASFGVGEWIWPELTAEVQFLLSKFKAISVREKSGVNICESVFKMQSTVVLDPTLLLGDFSRFIDPEDSDASYVLGYKFAPSPQYYNLLQKLSDELNSTPRLMDILTKNFSKQAFRLNPIFFPSPGKWLNQIAHSRFVITDSFHCMAFAILFQKDFVVLLTSDTNHLLKGRMLALLEELNLSDRVFYSADAVIKSGIWKTSIDYVDIDCKLSILRNRSFDFLKYNIESNITV